MFLLVHEIPLKLSKILRAFPLEISMRAKNFSAKPLAPLGLTVGHKTGFLAGS